MKNQALDVIMLCKGYYNREKYKNTKAALGQYYRDNYIMDISDEECTEELLFITLLKNTTDWLRENHPDRMAELYRVLMDNNIDRYLHSLMYEKSISYGSSEYFEMLKTMSYHKIMFHKVVAYLNLLSMHGCNKSDIDTSEYLEKVYKDGKFVKSNWLKDII